MKDPGKKPFIIAAVCCGLMSAYMGLPINAAGVFVTPVSDDLGLLRGTFSFHLTLLNLVNGFSALAVPFIFRHFKMKTVYWVSFAVTIAATLAMSRSSAIPVFYLLSVVRGFFGCLTCMMPVNMTLHNWFVKDLGKISSIVFAFTGVSGVVGTQVLSRVIEAYGWRTGYVVLAVMIAVCALPALLYPFRMSPAEQGMLPYGRHEGDGAAAEEDTPEPGVYRSGRFVTLMIIAFFMCFCTGLAQHFPGYAGTLGLTAAGAVMLSIAMGANVGSKFLAGILSDKLGAKKTVLILSAGTFAGITVLMVAASPAALYAGTIFYGGCYAIGAVMLSLLAVSFFRHADYDRVYMFANVVANTGTATALTAVGYIYDFTRSYRPAMALCLVFIAISMVSLITVKKAR